MGSRFAPWTWPILGVASPVLIPFLAIKNVKFKQRLALAERTNNDRIGRAQPLDLPELEAVQLTVLSELKTEDRFLGEAGVSYLLRSEHGALLFDVGFGPDHQVLAHNAGRLGITLQDVDALAISHLHPDHMGGMKAMRGKGVTLPESLGEPEGKPCFLPDEAKADGFSAHVVQRPQLLTEGIASTGPLARSLFFFGWTEEQALVARLRGKGLVVISGCGHPTVQVVLEMVSRLSDLPVHTVVGGFHFPVTEGRGDMLGLDIQTLLGTGKPPWERITDDDLTQAIAAFRRAAPARLLLSAHDTCDHALRRFSDELEAEVEVLRAGGSYVL